MDIYQILLTHNREWSHREIICFGIIVIGAGLILLRSVHRHRMKKTQALLTMILLLFLGIVFGSTVFTRTVTTRQYKLMPFWSWKEIILSHDWSLLQENLLNCILLLPMGVLLPLVLDRKIKLRTSFGMGVLVSFIIELSQLIFKRGLFEWDDMIHNGLGCMLGTAIVNVLWDRYHDEIKTFLDKMK